MCFTSYLSELISRSMSEISYFYSRAKQDFDEEDNIPLTKFKDQESDSDENETLSNIKKQKQDDEEYAPQEEEEQEAEEDEREFSSDEDDSDEDYDNPNRLWCICRQPHNNRLVYIKYFTICNRKTL